MEPPEVSAAKDDQRAAARDLEEINQALLSSARQAKLEDGAVVRLDSTMTSALMHEPSDRACFGTPCGSWCAFLKRADVLIGATSMAWRDHCRAAKKRARKIQFTRGRPNRVQLYRELITITRATLAYLEQASERSAVASTRSIALCQIQVRHYRPLVERIIRQSERRVLAGEPVPAGEKLVSRSKSMPISSSKAAAIPNTATSSTSPPAEAA